MDFDVLVTGGGAAGMSCALVLGSGMNKDFARGKTAGIIMHQKSSHLQDALFNNVLGIAPGTPGRHILKEGALQLKNYPQIQQIGKQKATEITPIDGGFSVKTNKEDFTAVLVVVAVGYTSLMRIRGLEEYVIPHKKTKESKNRIQLLNKDHVVIPGLYVAGTLAGWRSQFSIACGSGASVATDILTQWNNEEHTKVHDKI